MLALDPLLFRWSGDLEGDGGIEIIDTLGVTSRIQDGALVPYFDFGSSDYLLGDLDQDGLLDAVVGVDPGDGEDTPPQSAVLFGSQSWSTGHYVEGHHPVAIADFNGDGDHDILLNDFFVGNPFVLDFDLCPT